MRGSLSLLDYPPRTLIEMACGRASHLPRNLGWCASCILTRRVTTRVGSAQGMSQIPPFPIAIQISSSTFCLQLSDFPICRCIASPLRRVSHQPGSSGGFSLFAGESIRPLDPYFGSVCRCRFCTSDAENQRRVHLTGAGPRPAPDTSHARAMRCTLPRCGTLDDRARLSPARFAHPCSFWTFNERQPRSYQHPPKSIVTSMEPFYQLALLLLLCYLTSHPITFGISFGPHPVSISSLN